MTAGSFLSGLMIVVTTGLIALMALIMGKCCFVWGSRRASMAICDPVYPELFSAI